MAQPGKHVLKPVNMLAPLLRREHGTRCTKLNVL
jgi:hypothetical protein